MNDGMVAVTGAGGSLGSALTRRLLRGGHAVRALVRREEDAHRLREMGATPIVGDVRDGRALESLVRGCEAVFHLAAWMGKPFDEELAHAVNVGGAEGVVRAAAAGGARRVVLASSIAVYGPVLRGVVTEDAPLWSVGDMYGDTKIAAERAARREAERLGIELVVLRPTMIFGPESPSWTEEPFAAISKGLPAIIGSGEDLVDPVYVEDVARAFELAASIPEAAGETFNIGAGPRTWNEFFGAYATMAGKPLRRIPASVTRRAAQAGERAERLLGRRPRLPSEMVGVMTSRAVFSTEKAKRVLGFEPAYSFEEAMAETEAWLRSAGRLRRPSVALVTGAAGGLGWAVARRLREEGLTVWAADIQREALGGLAVEGIRTVALDVGSEESVRAVVGEIEAESGPVDLLVNVAGVGRPGPLESQPFGEVESHFDVNAYGPLRLARAVAPGMRRRGWGRILNVTSTNGFIVTPFMGAYSASKHALEAISDALRMELKPWGVEVGVIQPGAMKTAFAGRAQAALKASISGSNDGWSPYLKSFLDSSLWGTATATSPERVARVVARAALANRVPARSLATLDAIPARVMSMMPTAVRDAFLVRAAGLSQAPERDEASRNRAASPPPARSGR
ncbi:MAG TPA: SDR family NAD(P)-dependent oxidoreductase [Rubrobacteraceae bacterium]|nr:SDR family NAD(P)-dependent oxidoreductase [Rubrobacteraceae bacterium]